MKIKRTIIYKTYKKQHGIDCRDYTFKAVNDNAAPDYYVVA